MPAVAFRYHITPSPDLRILPSAAVQFHNSAFKVALIDQWLVVVSGSKMVDEFRKRSDEELSFIEGVEDVRK